MQVLLCIIDCIGYIACHTNSAFNIAYHVLKNDEKYHCNVYCVVGFSVGILCSNVRGQAVYLIDMTLPSPRYGIMLCSVTLVSDKRHMSELLVPGFGSIHGMVEMVWYQLGVRATTEQLAFKMSGVKHCVRLGV